jgi:hypothetical protein
MFEKRKRVSYFIIVCVIVRSDDECGTVMKKNNDGGWSFKKPSGQYIDLIVMSN